MLEESSVAVGQDHIRSGTLGREQRALARLLVPSLPFLLVLMVLAGGLLILYAGSLDDILVADDLGLVLHLKDAGFARVFTVWPGWQHYVPVQQLVLYVLANMAGFEPVAYHAAALFFGWMSAALVVVLTRQLTGRFEVAALAGILFVAFGTNWEPYLRAAAGIAYTAATALTLAGLSLYVRANDQRLSRRKRQLAYGGFLVALILAPLTYGLGITLIGACALYRFLVLEQGLGLSPAALARRARGWLRDFLLPALLVLLWLGFKASLGLSGQAPGLESSWESRVQSVGIGLLRIFLPGGIPALVDNLWTTLDPQVLLLVELGIIAIVVWRGTSVVRFLVLWATLLLVTMVAGTGESVVMASRHLYMSTAVASILWAILIWSLARPTADALTRLGAGANMSRILRVVPTLAVAVALGLTGSHYAAGRQAEWEAATSRADEILTQIERFSREHPSATQLYLIDLPAATRTAFGEPVPIIPAYSAAAQVELRLPGRFSEVVPVVTAFQGTRLPTNVAILASVEQAMQQPEALPLVYVEQEGEGWDLREWPALLDPAQLTRADGRPDAMITAIDGTPITTRQQRQGPITITVSDAETRQQRQGPVSYSQADVLTVTGWAAYASADGRAGGVLVTVDNQRHIWAAYPTSRLQQKPQSLNEEVGLPWRFVATIPAYEIGMGRHTLSLKVLAPDQESYQETEAVEIEVTAATSGTPNAATLASPERDGARSPTAATPKVGDPTRVPPPDEATPVADTTDQDRQNTRATRQAARAERQDARATRQEEQGN